MPKDVIVVVNLDAKPNPSEALDILILSTAGAKDPAIYRSLEEANVNVLTEEYKKQYVKNGVCCDGEFIDNQLGADYIASYMREELYAVLLENAKVPYTDAGFALVAGAVFATLNRATDLGIIARDPESDAGVFSVVVPKRADATDEEARARQMPDITWEALHEGAVHRVKVVGTLRATLTA